MSELRAGTVSDAAGTGPAVLTGQYATKGWIQFDGTGTVAIEESFNVSSLNDAGTGNYDWTMTNAMSTSTFCTPAANNRHMTNAAPSSTTVVDTNSRAGPSDALADAVSVSACAIGDLA